MVTKFRFRYLRVGIIVVLVSAMIIGLIWSLRGRGIRVTLITHINSMMRIFNSVIDSGSITNFGEFKNIIFLHHSVGTNLIEQGGMRKAFTEAGYEFWDHGYNDEGLTRPDGTPTGYGYNIPQDNTDPSGFAEIFSQKLYSWPLNAFSGLMQHEVIIVKSCFPVSNINSDEQLESYRDYYLSMLDVMKQYPQNFFILLTPPPLNPVETTRDSAKRARIFAEWLKSNEVLSGQDNVYTFDLFDLLAEDDPQADDYNMLKRGYREGEDSHPNIQANQIIGPLLVEFVISNAETYSTYEASTH